MLLLPCTQNLKPAQQQACGTEWSTSFETSRSWSPGRKPSAIPEIQEYDENIRHPKYQPTCQYFGVKLEGTIISIPKVEEDL